MIDESALPYSEVTCECKTEEIILLSCAGGSNCGQITNNVAVKLTQDGVKSNLLPRVWDQGAHRGQAEAFRLSEETSDCRFTQIQQGRKV